MKKTIETKRKEETQDLGYRLGKLIKQPVTLLMFGDLGAGKTTFTQGLAKGLGVTRRVNSPTFNILKIYQGRLPLYHLDAYRLEGIHQDLGFEEYLEDSDGVVVVEWPMYITDLLPENNIRITIVNGNDDQRMITIETNGVLEQALAKEWLC